MNRRKIEIAHGSIARVERTLWSAATEKLHEAQVGLEHMMAAQDSISFEKGWTCAVDSLAEFWSRFFDEGKSRFTNFQPWAGVLEKDWKNNGLLMYLYQARHLSQHGTYKFEWETGLLQIEPNFNGHIKNIEIFTDGTFAMKASKLDGSSTEATVRYVGGHARLTTIKNKREGKEYLPPSESDGMTVRQLSPIEAVTRGLDYYKKILEMAHLKFGRE
jgi:hypothetical protein